MEAFSVDELRSQLGECFDLMYDDNSVMNQSSYDNQLHDENLKKKKKKQKTE